MHKVTTTTITTSGDMGFFSTGTGSWSGSGCGFYSGLPLRGSLIPLE